MISRTRRNFRRFLFVLLGLSACLFALPAMTYAALRADLIEMKDISPTLFQIDVAHFQTRAYFSDQEGQHVIAQHLLRKGFFSRTYSNAGREMIDTLIKEQYAPAKKTKADVIMRTAVTDADRQLAMALYRSAAQQHFVPAIAALNQLD